MVEIEAKSKNQNLYKSRFKDLFILKKIQNIDTIRESYYITSNVGEIFPKLK